MRLEAHAAEGWSLAVSRDGGFVVSGGHDRSLRLWERTDEPVFLDEERERELEAAFDAELDEGDPGRRDKPNDATVGIDEMAPDESSALAGRRTLESVKAAERLMEALETALEEDKAIASRGDGEDGRANPLMLGLSPQLYVLRALRMIKAPELEQALLVLPFHLVELLCNYLVQLLHSTFEVELCSRCAIFLVRIHQAQIVANRAMLEPLRALQRVLRTRLQQQLGLVGQNVAALRHINPKPREHTDHEPQPRGNPSKRSRE